MEVTNTNFKEVLLEIKEVINRATFLAIDCEFSGLNVVSEINAFDTPKQYYEKVRKNCREFLVIQYGISAFRFDPDDDVFKQQTYNFYIFRRPINQNIPDQRFLCQTSSINFLTSQGFDFNKLFKSGISYMNLSEEANYRGKLEENQKMRSNQNTQQSPSKPTPIPPEIQPMIDDIIKQLGEFLDSDGAELELPKCNSFIRRLIYQTTAEKYKNRVLLHTKQLKNKDRVLIATKFKSKEEREEIEKKMADEEFSVMDDFLGFTKVLRLIVESEKLVVGHNMCLDFLHTIDKFLTPLSVDYEEFKECAHSLFKNVLDTKYMSSADDFKDVIPSTILKDLLETVSKEPFKIPPVEIEKGGQGYSIEDVKEHEAGYDAFITGLCFLSMWNYLGISQNMSFRDIFKDFKLLEPFMNKLFLAILRDNQYIHLGGQDPNPSRDHVFYLTFPRDWKLTNIIELFSPFGWYSYISRVVMNPETFCYATNITFRTAHYYWWDNFLVKCITGNVYVAWINETSAYVGLYKRDQAAVALSTLSQSDTYSIMSYSKRQSQLDGIKTPFSSPICGVKRKRNFENLSKNNKKFETHVSQASYSKKFEPILEDVEAEVSGTPKKISKKETSKTFVESDAWD